MRLFDETTLRTLEHLSLRANSVRVGVMKGNRRSRRRGASIEFADYRDYAQGDDLRRLDWNVFARLERPLIKLTEEEEDLAVHLLVDTSDSMDWPQEEADASTNKLHYCLRLTGALAYIALTSGDLVQVTLADTSQQSSWGPFRGRQNGWPLFQFLEAHLAARQQKIPSGRRTALAPMLRDYAQRARRPGLLFLLSDLLSPVDFREGLTALLARGYEIVLLHILSPDEATPVLAGDLRLIDSETGETAEVSIDPLLLDAYTTRLSAWQEELRQFCGPRGIHYTPVTTDLPWDALIRGALQREGVVR